ncbi:MGMT family protein [Anaeromyxobacter terrae]|uniref:MGMT family protein n=1 Tax=Anaeromyxobacter terrae TaxID=2925406 RepID=UPI001F59B0BE|nr:MGMT family protein [Anaeromyxobacter sp. SG22]
MTLPSGWSRIYQIVRRIPRGRVATYGEVALAAGKPHGARQVGYALAALRGARHDVPWQRVLGARPRGHAAISILDPMGAAVQRELLEAEGVRFDERGRVELARHGWKKRGRAPARAKAAPGGGRRRGASPRRPRTRSRRAAAGAPGGRYPWRTGATFQISSA